MGKFPDEVIENIKSIFPKLADDFGYDVSSPDDENYNCIAWAYNYKDRWMWPGGEECKTLDGFHYWPDGVKDETDVDAFIDAFKLQGYEVCNSWEHEDGYRKIALYVKEGKCTHASRELVGSENTCGKWSSKLGKSNDIEHGTPYTIEGDIYGEVYCFMKIAF